MIFNTIWMFSKLLSLTTNSSNLLSISLHILMTTKTMVVITKGWCRDPSLGLATTVRGCKVASQEKDPGVTSHALESAKSAREWTFTFQNEFPCWSWSLKWTLESSKRDYRGQNPLPWRVHYIIENLLKRRCLKWVHIAHLDIWNTSYGQKKG